MLRACLVRLRRYGFVTFTDTETAAKVRQQGSLSFMGKTMNVGEAMRRKPRAAPPHPRMFHQGICIFCACEYVHALPTQPAHRAEALPNMNYMMYGPRGGYPPQYFPPAPAPGPYMYYAYPYYPPPPVDTMNMSSLRDALDGSMMMMPYPPRQQQHPRLMRHPPPAQSTAPPHGKQKDTKDPPP